MATTKKKRPSGYYFVKFERGDEWDIARYEQDQDIFMFAGTSKEWSEHQVYKVRATAIKIPK